MAKVRRAYEQNDAITDLSSQIRKSKALDWLLEHVEIVSHRCRTHTVSNTAFRGFGGPQGMVVIEAVMDHIARELGLDPLTLLGPPLLLHGSLRDLLGDFPVPARPHRPTRPGARGRAPV